MPNYEKLNSQKMTHPIVRCSESSWSSPHIVKKMDGMWQPCKDYKQLDLAIKPDLYLPPHIEDLSTKLAGMNVFSTIDLRK